MFFPLPREDAVERGIAFFRFPSVGDARLGRTLKALSQRRAGLLPAQHEWLRKPHWKGQRQRVTSALK